MKCLFRFFHSFKVGIHPKIEGGTVHRLLKQCVYTLRARDGMYLYFFSFCSHYQGLVHSKVMCSYCTHTNLCEFTIDEKKVEKAVICQQKMGMC